MCRRIAKVEWSGVLFYSVEGSIKDPKNMVITIEDILPMNKGTQAYTEYSFDERVLEYMMENETMEKGWKMGHIHSHNTMAVFFSGTDWSELEDNAPNHNFYVSLIVNNFMDFCAKVCFVSKSDESKSFTFFAKDENGEKYVASSEDYVVKEEKLVVYDCEIESPRQEISVEEEFAAKVSFIIEDAEKKELAAKAKTAANNIHTRKFNNVNHTPSYTPTWGEKEEDYRFDNTDESDWNPTSNKKTEKGFTGFKGQFQEEDEVQDEIEHFAMYVLNTGNDLRDFSDIDDIVGYYKGYNLTGKALAKSILEKYNSLYEAFFDKKTDALTPEKFIIVTEGVIDELIDAWNQANGEVYTKNLLDPVIDALKSLVDKFEKAMDLDNNKHGHE